MTSDDQPTARQQQQQEREQQRQQELQARQREAQQAQALRSFEGDLLNVVTQAARAGVLDWSQIAGAVDRLQVVARGFGGDGGRK